MERIALSPQFRNSERMTRFLRFVVQKSLAGESDSLKEYRIALEVFDRSESFDPRTDTIVRVEARRLRKKLEEYYAAAEREPVRISIPSPGYVPAFESANGAAALASPAELAPLVVEPIPAPQHARRPSGFRVEWRRLVWIAAGLATALGFGGYVLANRMARLELGSQIRTLAILPLKPLGTWADSDQEALGLTDALISRIGTFPELIVRPTSAVRPFITSEDPVSAGSRLQVDAILDGTLQRSGDRLRVAVQMLRVSDGKQIWTERFDLSANDLFALEDAVSERAAWAMRRDLSPTARRDAARQPTSNAEAYDLYLKGRYHMLRATAEGMQTAMKHFSQAVEKDPKFANAYASLAEAWGGMAHYGLLPASEAAVKRSTYLEKALALDPDLAEAHDALGRVHLYVDWDPARAERELTRATELNPNLAEAHLFLGLSRLVAMRPEGGESRRALILDPLSTYLRMGLGWTHYYERDFAGAVAEYRKALEVDADYAPAYWCMGEALEQEHQFEEAIAAFEKSAALTNRSPRATSGLAHAYGLAGQNAKALAIIAQLRETAKRSYVTPYYMAVAYAGVNDSAQMYEWLERSYEERSDWLVWLHTQPLWDPFRKDPRWIALEQRVGIWAK